MCDKLKPKCPQSALDSCRVNCTKYDPPPSGCDDVVRGALECARDAADLVCANVAPESCAKKFREIAACASGAKPVAAPSDSGALPAGFVRFEDQGAGFAAPMPGKVEVKGEGEKQSWTAQHPDGASYSVRRLPRPAEAKLSEKIFLRVAMNLLGRCSDKMKMQGMVDKPGRTSIHYATKCPDGSEEAGVFWATEKQLFVASVRGPAGKLGPSDTFLYGFEAR